MLTLAPTTRIPSQGCFSPASGCVVVSRDYHHLEGPKTDEHPQHVTAPPDNQKNFLVVDAKTDNAAVEAAFDKFTTERKDIGIVLINQHVSHGPVAALPAG